MGSRLNVVEYNDSLKKLALNFHSGNQYLDNFLRSEHVLDKNIGKTYVFYQMKMTLLLVIIILEQEM